MVTPLPSPWQPLVCFLSLWIYRCPSTDKWMNKMRYIHTMEYCSAMKGAKYWYPKWTPSKTWCWVKEARHKWLHTVCFHLIWNTPELFHFMSQHIPFWLNQFGLGCCDLQPKDIDSQMYRMLLGFGWYLALIWTSPCILTFAPHQFIQMSQWAQLSLRSLRS